MSSSSPEPTLSAPATRQGTIVKKSQGSYSVRADGQLLECAISSRLRKQLVYPTAAPTSLHHRVQAVKEIAVVDPVAVGDRVAFTPADHATGLITQVLPRRNRLIRPAAGHQPLEQVIVANVDQVVAVMSLAQPAPKWNLLDRYLAAAEATRAPSLIVITKADVPHPAEHEADIELYRRLGYRVIVSSATTGQGLADLRGALQERFSVLVGKSGVGKTTLINAIEPGLGLRVRQVSAATTKGRHTTTHVEMFDLPFGGQIVDTPGMREFGLWRLDPVDLAQAFVDLRPHVGQCKFGLSCQHTVEPGCAVKAAVEAGLIAERRHASYVRMLKG